MDIRQCARCDKLFHFRGNRNCPACVQELDEIFLSVRNYLDSHPQACMDDVCEACGADEEEVLRWLREGRLILSRDSTPLLTCQLCRGPIQSGRYCEACSVKVIGQLETSTRQMNGKPHAPGKAPAQPHDKNRRIHMRINE